MSTLRIAAAQSISLAGDIAANIDIHLKFMRAAHQTGVNFLVFPELSLSGYELPLLKSLAIKPDDTRLGPIRKLVNEIQMTVVIGVPLEAADGITISAITFFPDDTMQTYHKQYVHSSEAPYAISGERINLKYPLGDESFALGICADTTHPIHAEQAAATGASLYVASVLVSESGYAKDAALLQGYAKQHHIGVLMANHAGPSGEYISAGKSAFWAPDGSLIVTALGTGNALIIATKNGSTWSGEVIDVTL
ncbi:carbon-nitrogen hydrolase family protein [Aquirhabdus sp.]|uniref:carbon-nitrogen hydrolase family protein n=1 Tax=Aquirhabdus sp. TaxID=2824160 RepID=UPI00396C4877